MKKASLPNSKAMFRKSGGKKRIRMTEEIKDNKLST
jgi:hypothetical protein